MSNRTITRADLAEAIYNKLGLSRNESSDLVEQVLDEVMNALISGENVKLSSFGSFSIREKGNFAKVMRGDGEFTIVSDK